MLAKPIMCCCFVLLLFLPGAAPVSAVEPLRIGVLLIEDAVPLHVAEAENLYEAEGVEVELVPFLSALERDSALTAKAIDGAVSDPVGAILFDRGRGIVKITSLLLGATPEEGAFAILAAPGSGLEKPSDLKKVPVAVSNATIIEYVTERLLEAAGFSEQEIRTIEVKKMPIRMQMLLSGSVKAATLPEPLASIARSKGARLLLSDTETTASLSQTVMIFRSEVITERRDEVNRFFAALASGVEMINNSPESFRELFVEKSRVPPFLADSYAIPRYPSPAPYGRELFDEVMSWLVKKDLAAPLTHEFMVERGFMENQR